MINECPTLRIFFEDSPTNCPTHLAHAIAAQTHRDTKAMARALPHNEMDKLFEIPIFG